MFHDCMTGDDSAPVGRWPDFFIIGAMKSGSTTLANQLSRCAGVHISHPKEPQYFSGGRFARLGTAAYLRLFATASSKQKCGDASTCYSRYPHHGDVPARIAARCPDTRLIYLLRDPADRVYSHYLHDMQHLWLTDRQEPIPFSEAWTNNPEYLDASRYILQIAEYRRFYSDDALMLCTTAELRRDPKRLVTRICRFLDADPSTTGFNANLRSNESLGQYFRHTSGKTACAKIRHSLPGRLLAPFLPDRLRQSLGRQVRRLSASTLGERELRQFRSMITPYTSSDRQTLVDALLPSIQDLEDYWHQDLSGWKSLK